MDSSGELEGCRRLLMPESSDRFNKKYNYPFVFLNDQPFSDEFKKYTSGIASSACTYGQIPADHWDEQPVWIDQVKAKAAREEMERKEVIYGGSLSYRKMCACPFVCCGLVELMR